MPYNFFQPKPGRFGVMPVAVTVRPVFGTLAAGTVVHNLGAYPGVCYINKISIAGGTFPTAATSIAATLAKKPSGTAVPLTSGIDINTQTADTAVQGTFLTTLTDAQRTLNPGETLQLSVVTTGSVTVQPVDVIVTIELLVVE
jgi:hypothetical protein